MFLESLPDDIVYTILPYINYKQLAQLRLCNRETNHYVVVFLANYDKLRTVEDVVARVMHGPYLPVSLQHASIAAILKTAILPGLQDSTVHKCQVSMLVINHLNLAAGVLNGDMHFVQREKSRILFSRADVDVVARIIGSLHFVVQYLRVKGVGDNRIAHAVSRMYASASASSQNTAFMTLLKLCSNMYIDLNDVCNVLGAAILTSGQKMIASPCCFDAMVSTLCYDQKAQLCGNAAQAMVLLLAARQNIEPQFGIEFMPVFSVANFDESDYNLNTYNCCSESNKTVMLVLLVRVGQATPTYAELKSRLRANRMNNIIVQKQDADAVVIENIFTVTCALVCKVGRYLLQKQK